MANVRLQEAEAAVAVHRALLTRVFPDARVDAYEAAVEARYAARLGLTAEEAPVSSQ